MKVKKWKVKVKSLSCVQLLVTPWTAAYQAPSSMKVHTWMQFLILSRLNIPFGFWYRCSVPSPKKYCSTKWAAQSKWTHKQAGMKGQGWYHPSPMASLCSCLPAPHTITAQTTFLSSVLPLYIETFLRMIFHHLTNKKQNPSVSQSRSSIWSQVNVERLILNLFIHKHKETLFPFVVMPRCDHKSGQDGKDETSFFWDKFWSHFCEKS